MEVDKGVLRVSIYESSLLKFGVEGGRGWCRSGSAVGCHSSAAWHSITLPCGRHSKCRRCCSCGEAEQCPQSICVSGCALIPNLRGTNPLCSQPKGSFWQRGYEDCLLRFSNPARERSCGQSCQLKGFGLKPYSIAWVQVTYTLMCQWGLRPAEHIPAAPPNL